MSAFAGIDFDTHAVHVVVLPEEGTVVYRRFELEGHDSFERTRAIRDAMPSRSWWKDQGIVAVGLEVPWGPNKGRLHPVFGGVLACLPRELLVQPLEPARWRHAVGLPGNASKGHVKALALSMLISKHGTPTFMGRAQYPAWINDWTQDACDAYCLALAVSKLTEDVAA